MLGDKTLRTPLLPTRGNVVGCSNKVYGKWPTAERNFKVCCVHFSSPTLISPPLPSHPLLSHLTPPHLTPPPLPPHSSSSHPPPLPPPPTLVARISSSDSSSYVITPERRSKPGTSVHSLVSVLPLRMKHRKMRASLGCSRSVLQSVNQSLHQLVNQLINQSTNQIFNVQVYVIQIIISIQTVKCVL